MCLGVPGRVVRTWEDGTLSMGAVDFGGVTRDVCLTYVDVHAGIGDFVIVHAGCAISIVDEQEARRTLKLLRELPGATDVS